MAELVVPRDPIQRWKHYKRNPWDFLMRCVYTLDQVNKANPIKTLPDKQYAYAYCKTWQRYPMLAVPKTRRMTMSWFTIALYVHDTIFNKGRFNAFVSKKEDDANELVLRAKFIMDHIPEDEIPRELLPKYRDKFCILEFPEIQSKIQGFPQGADQLRQFTFSGIFGDECAFWDQAQAFYSASLPTIDGGGRMTLVSSPAPGFFKKLCFDALDAVGEINVAEFVPDATQVTEGLRVWRNEKNRFAIFELHYTADPGKRSPEYRDTIKASMPLMEYLREYELHWDTFFGYPVYPEFSKLHATNEEPHPVAGLPMLIGFDFGLTPAAVIGQLQEDRLVIFREYVEVNMGAVRFSERIASEIRLRWPTHSSLKKDWRCFIDPAGVFRADTDENSCARILAEKGFVPSPGPINFEERKKAVVHWLQKLTTKGPALQVYGKGCPMIVKGFEGGYKYPEKAGDVEPNKLRPIKDAYSHPHDALQYLCSGIKDLQAQLRKQIPRPHYSLQNQGRRHG